MTNGIPKARRSELHAAMNTVVKARIVFQKCKPIFPKHHFHFMIVPLPKLVDMLRTDFARQNLRLGERELSLVITQLESNLLPTLHSIRRSSALPRAKSFIEHFDIIDEDADTLVSETVGHDSNTTSMVGALGRSINATVTGSLSIGKVKDMVVHPTSIFKRRSADETEISFSMFLQALQMVCRDKLLVHSRRRSAVSVNKPYPSNQEFSEYLS
jgi:hypothetical protein